MENNISLDFSIEVVEKDTNNMDNSNVQSGCFGDTGSGRYC